MRCCFYLDDIIFFASSLAELLRVRALALRLLHRLGLRVSVKKSLLRPGQLIAHLDMLLCSRTAWLYVPDAKVMAFKR